MLKNKKFYLYLLAILLIIVCIFCFFTYREMGKYKQDAILNGSLNTYASFDTEYRKSIYL